MQKIFNEKDLKDFDPISVILHEKLMAGFTRTATKCYFIQLNPKVPCPDYAIGHAVMKTGTSRTQICTILNERVSSQNKFIRGMSLL